MSTEGRHRRPARSVRPTHPGPTGERLPHQTPRLQRRVPTDRATDRRNSSAARAQPAPGLELVEDRAEAFAVADPEQRPASASFIAASPQAPRLPPLSTTGNQSHHAPGLRQDLVRVPGAGEQPGEEAVQALGTEAWSVYRTCPSQPLVDGRHEDGRLVADCDWPGQCGRHRRGHRERCPGRCQPERE